MVLLLFTVMFAEGIGVPVDLSRITPSTLAHADKDKHNSDTTTFFIICIYPRLLVGIWLLPIRVSGGRVIRLFCMFKYVQALDPHVLDGISLPVTLTLDYCINTHYLPHEVGPCCYTCLLPITPSLEHWISSFALG